MLSSAKTLPHIKSTGELTEDLPPSPENGRFIVVLDSESRENEGDLIVAASHITQRKLAFMVAHTTGIVCAPMSAALTQSLRLPQMVADNTEPHQTAFTVSVDAADAAVTTGASAHDRALTCRMLASPSATPESFRRPGHIFPLRARKGGVRERKGHTEAAVDFCRLAGVREVAVISELVKPEGEAGSALEDTGGDMMRRDDCLAFGKAKGLKVCTIEALVEYLDRIDGKVNGYKCANE
ncbi:MAG: hypothetical protein LQ340_000430 [Diploschistes diacapsis]|nr:MAG: hypothetical protein LQ340_000430 [Diploschistes diacapsis]